MSDEDRTEIGDVPVTSAFETAANDQPELAYSSEPDAGDQPEPESTHRWRNAALIAAGIIAICGIVAGIVGFGGRHIEREHRQPATPAALEAPSGYYESVADVTHATFENSDNKLWRLDEPSNQLFQSNCGTDQCTMALMTRLAIEPVEFTLRRDGQGGLVSDEAAYTPCWGGKGTYQITLAPTKDGFRGVKTIAITSGCHFDKPIKASFPFTLAPTTPYEPLPIPRAALLQGQYKSTLLYSKATYTNSTAADWGDSDADYVGYIEWSTSCDQGGCTAVSSTPSGKTDNGGAPISYTLRWANGSWTGGAPDQVDRHGSVSHLQQTLTPDGHGGFNGFDTQTCTSGPGAGISISMPVKVEWDSF